jgi:hypothetical protein
MVLARPCVSANVGRICCRICWQDLLEVPKADQLELTAHIMIFTRRVEFKRIPDADVAGRQLADR